MTDKDTAHIRFTLDIVLDANGEDHEYLAQRMNSAFGRAIGDGAITGESAAETDVVDSASEAQKPLRRYSGFSMCQSGFGGAVQADQLLSASDL